MTEICEIGWLLKILLIRDFLSITLFATSNIAVIRLSLQARGDIAALFGLLFVLNHFASHEKLSHIFVEIGWAKMFLCKT